MRIIRHTLNNRIWGAVLIVLSILLVGLIPIRNVYAASHEVEIPYRQTWTNESGQTVNESFEYRLTALNGAPLPDEATGEFYQFELKGNDSGVIKLHFPFTKPGYYKYLVSSYIENRDSDYTYDERSYELMIMVTNAENGLGISAMTIQDESLAKYAELPFSVAYNVGPPDPGAEDDTEDDTTPGTTPGRTTPAGNGRAGAAGGTGAGTGTGIPNTETPAAIENPRTPLGIFDEPEDWALLNLILMILTIIVAFADGLLYFTKPTDKYGDEYEEEEVDVKRHGFPRIMAIVAAIISVILFFLTEDMTDPMIWVDEYTVWMLILFIATAILTMMSKKETDQDQDDLEPAA